MVDALSEVHRILVPGGILIDARPDSRVPAFAERRKTQGFQRFGLVGTARVEVANDRASDRAIECVLGERLFRRKTQGRFWHLVPFEGLAELRQYLSEHMRFARRAKWVVDAKTRRRYGDEPFVIRRGVRFEILERRRTQERPERLRARGDS